MTHISSIGAGVFSDLSYMPYTTTPNTAAGFASLFATTYNRFPNIRELPEMGNPANIVNVPSFGKNLAQQVNGQADLPTMQVTINYVPSDGIDALVGDGIMKTFRLALLNSQPADYTSAAAGLGSVPNTQFFFNGKVEALVVKSSLTDANTAVVTLSMYTSLFGPFTNSNAAVGTGSLNFNNTANSGLLALLEDI
jgi:hypothetical protein